MGAGNLNTSLHACTVASYLPGCLPAAFTVKQLETDGREMTARLSAAVCDWSFCGGQASLDVCISFIWAYKWKLETVHWAVCLFHEPLHLWNVCLQKDIHLFKGSFFLDLWSGQVRNGVVGKKMFSV